MARIITEIGLTKKRYRVVRLVFATQWRTIPGSSFESRAIRSGRPSPMPFRAAQPETGLLRIDIPSLHSRRLADPEAMPTKVSPAPRLNTAFATLGAQESRRCGTTFVAAPPNPSRPSPDTDRGSTHKIIARAIEKVIAVKSKPARTQSPSAAVAAR